VKPIEIDKETVDSIYNFVTTALSDYKGVLIHSVNGKNRCCVAALLVLMQRFRWGLIKTLEFLNHKKPGLEMTATLLKKLLLFETTLEKDKVGFLSKDWNTTFKQGLYYEEEKLIHNSYSNSLKAPVLNKFIPTVPSKKKHHTLRWIDHDDPTKKLTEVFGQDKAPNEFFDEDLEYLKK
jgi:hypothetical protein